MLFRSARECAYLNGQVIMLDGAHHLAHGSLFSPLLELDSAQWDAISAQIRADDAGDKAKRPPVQTQASGALVP